MRAACAACLLVLLASVEPRTTPPPDRALGCSPHRYRSWWFNLWPLLTSRCVLFSLCLLAPPPTAIVPPPVVLQAAEKQKLSLMSALSKQPKPAGRTTSLPSPGGDPLLDELLHMNEQAAKDAELAAESQLTPLSQLLAERQAKNASNEVAKVAIRVQAAKDGAAPLVDDVLDIVGAKALDKRQKRSVGAVAPENTASQKLPLDQKAVEERRAVIEAAIQQEVKDMRADRDRRLMAIRQQMDDQIAEEKKLAAAAELQLKDRTMRREKLAAERQKLADDKIAEDKIAEVERRRQEKRAKQKPAERKQEAAKLADELREVRDLRPRPDLPEAPVGDGGLCDGGHRAAVVKIGDIISMTFGSRARKMGVVKTFSGDGRWKIDLDCGECVEAQLQGQGAKEFKVHDEVPPDMIRFKANEGALFNNSNSTLSSLDGEIDGKISAFTITDSLEFFDVRPNTKAAREWIEACGTGKAIFLPCFSPTDAHPKPLDIKGTFRFNKDSKSCMLESVQMHVASVASFDPLTKTVLQASEKGIGLVFSVFGAGANQEVAIAGKDGRKWKAGAAIDDNAPTAAPLDVRHLSADINAYSEVRYRSCSTSTDLQNIIGLSAYMQAVKAVSGHPLFRDLVELQWPAAMGCADILTAMRALADGNVTPRGTEILAKHVADTAARSVSTPIARQYEDSHAEGIQKKEHSRAMTDYKKRSDAMFAMLSPGTTEVAKLMPRVAGRTAYQQFFEAAMRNHTPDLPKVKSAARAAAPAVPHPEANTGDKTEASTGGSAPAPRKTRAKVSPLVPDSAALVAPSRAKVAPVVDDSNDTSTASSRSPTAKASSRMRKSAIAVEGSPNKGEEEPDGKRGKVSSAEELAESMNALPKILGQMQQAADLLHAATKSEGAAKDAIIEGLREQLETANQKISRLESEKSMLLQAKTDSMVKAAKAEGIAEQLELNMKKSEGQLNSWVSMRFRLASYEADMSLSDCSGSVIP